MAPYYKWRDAHSDLPRIRRGLVRRPDQYIRCHENDKPLTYDSQPNWDLWPTPHDVFSHALKGGLERLTQKHRSSARGIPSGYRPPRPQGHGAKPSEPSSPAAGPVRGRPICKARFISGQQVVSDGRLTLIDEDSLRRDASEIRQQQRQTPTQAQSITLSRSIVRCWTRRTRRFIQTSLSVKLVIYTSKKEPRMTQLVMTAGDTSFSLRLIRMPQRRSMLS